MFSAAQRAKHGQRRIEDIEKAFERIKSRDRSVDLTPNHELACGHIITDLSLTVDSNLLVMHVILDGIPGHVEVPEKRFDSLRSMATFFYRFLTEATLCKDCASVEVDHDCDSTIQAALFGCEEDVCAICLDPCLGTTSLKCGHRFHRTCAAGIEGRCPVCRRTVMVET